MIDRITVYRYVTYNDIFRKPEGFCADSNDNCVEKYEIEIPNDPMIEDVYTTDWGRICFKFKEKYYPCDICDICSFLKETKDKKTLYVRVPFVSKTIHFPIISRKRLY